MYEATVIYPHQLFIEHPGLAKNRPVFLVEEPLLLTEFPIHRQKLLLHRLSMEAYAAALQTKGHHVTLLSLSEIKTTEDTYKVLAKKGFTHLHITDTTDTWLEKRIAAALSAQTQTRIFYDSPLFILTKVEAMERYLKSKRHMARFYQGIRQKLTILMEEDGQPHGGQWSFDAENRQKLPKNIALPSDLTRYSSPEILNAQKWLTTIEGELYGDDSVWLPYTHASAEAYLKDFLKERLENFGPYEDALTVTHTRLFHSTLSPLINIGLLTPQQVIDAALSHAKKHTIPLASLEGFIRQIIGWREFIRASYEVDGGAMRTKNFWNHTNDLPSGFWTGETGLLPLDTSINAALQYGYNHHIERLMVLGNFLLLQKTHPDLVYRWFMAMYVDAYDWVMVPNVYGMSQFADGGLFATKPYISGSNYLTKMSDYGKGDWTKIWDALYWNFIYEHSLFFLKNHRLSMMPRLLEKMDPVRKAALLKTAADYLKKK